MGSRLEAPHATPRMSAIPNAPALRPYQRDAIEAVLAARKSGVRRMVVCLPTGAGKTVIFSQLAQLARRQVLVLAHREELLAQACEKIARATGGASVVAIEQGAQRAPEDAKVLVCSIRSLHEERLARVMRGRDVGLVIYDECHHAAADDNLRVLRQLGAFDAEWPRVIEHLERFRPEFIILQCGADSVEGDPITHMRFSPGAHSRAARDLCRLAERLRHGRVLGLGGGGYNRGNLARAWSGVVESFLED